MVEDLLTIPCEQTEEILKGAVRDAFNVQKQFDSLSGQLRQLMQIRLPCSQGEGLELQVEGLKGLSSTLSASSRLKDIRELCDREDPFLVVAAHESPRTTKLYDRTTDQVTLDEVEKIVV